jgi:hypothetical protein
VAQHGTVDDVIAVARHFAEHGAGPLVPDGDRFYADFPGFRDPAKGFPDEWFDATAEAYRSERQLGSAWVGWGRAGDGRPALTLSWRTWLPPRPGEEEPVVKVGGGPVVPAQVHGAFGQVLVNALIPLDELVAGQPRLGARDIFFVRSGEGQKARYRLSVKDVSTVRGRLHRVGRKVFLIGVAQNKKGVLRLVVLPLAIGLIADRLRRR